MKKIIITIFTLGLIAISAFVVTVITVSALLQREIDEENDNEQEYGC